MASFTRRAAYWLCVMAESRTLQSTASVWSGVITFDKSIPRTNSYSASVFGTSASPTGRSTRTAVRSHRLAL